MSALSKIRSTFEAFNQEATKFEDGNKSAGARARKHSLELGKLCATFRKESIAQSK